MEHRPHTHFARGSLAAHAPQKAEQLWNELAIYTSRSDAGEEWGAGIFYRFLLSCGLPFIRGALFDLVMLIPSVSKRRELIKIATPDFTEIIEQRLPKRKDPAWVHPPTIPNYLHPKWWRHGGWPISSEEAKEFVRLCLTHSQADRPDVHALCESPYLRPRPRG